MVYNMGWIDTLRKSSKYYALSADKRYTYHLREMKKSMKDKKEYWYESDRFGIQRTYVYGGKYEFHRQMAEKAKRGEDTLYEPENGYEEYESKEYKNAEKTHHLAFDPFNLGRDDYPPEG